MSRLTEPLRYCSFFLTHPEHWAPCSKEHHDLVKANPDEWPGYEVRAMATIPGEDVLVPLKLLQQAATWADIASRWQISEETQQQLSRLSSELRALHQAQEAGV